MWGEISLSLKKKWNYPLIDTVCLSGCYVSDQPHRPNLDYQVQTVKWRCGWWFVLFRETCRWSYKLSVIPPAVREKHIRSTFLWLSVAFTILLIYKVESDSAAAAHTHCRLYSHRGFEPLNTFCWMCYRKQAFSSPLSENAVNTICPSATHLHRVVCSDFHQVLDELSSMLKVDVGCK